MRLDTMLASVKNVRGALAQLIERTSSASAARWKDTPPTSPPEQLPGDEGAFIRVVTALRERDDIGPLLHLPRQADVFLRTAPNRD
jgi:hypothetical protein